MVESSLLKEFNISPYKGIEMDPSFINTQAEGLSSNIYLNSTLTPAQATRTLTLKRKVFDNDCEPLKAAIEMISKAERDDLDCFETFSHIFKRQRIKLGFTQGDVGQALGKRYGTDFSQTTISRFEALNLSYKNMCKLYPILKEWIIEAEYNLINGKQSIDNNEQDSKNASPSPEDEEIVGKNRRKRTFFDENQSKQLREEFNKCCRPNQVTMIDISNRLGLPPDVVRIWFSNYRQKLRKEIDDRLTLQLNGIQSSNDL